VRAWWKRKRVWVPAALVGLLVAGALVVVPALPAIRFLRRLPEPEPDAAWGVAHGAPSEAAPRAAGEPARLRVEPPAGGAEVVVVHGLAEEGVADPRLWRLAAAFSAAGFGVTVPEVSVLRDLRTDPRAAGTLAGPGASAPGARELSLAADAVVAAVPRGRPTLLVGVSVGGALALRAAARAGEDVRAVLLVGAPDDVVACARGWFRRADAPEGADAAAAARAEAGRFARAALLRSALPWLVADASEVERLGAWLRDAKGWRADPLPPDARPTSEAGRRLERVALAGERASEEDVEWALSGAKGLLEGLSPAHREEDLARLACPVFLVHGVSDPLVPVEEMARLAARLRGRVAVETLSSRLVAHVGVEDPGIAETWRHVRFLSRAFDAVERGG
jgi:pimeloyl-ACP methyl ester carboxylesterase